MAVRKMNQRTERFFCAASLFMANLCIVLFLLFCETLHRSGIEISRQVGDDQMALLSLLPTVFLGGFFFLEHWLGQGTAAFFRAIVHAGGLFFCAYMAHARLYFLVSYHLLFVSIGFFALELMLDAHAIFAGARARRREAAEGI